MKIKLIFLGKKSSSDLLAIIMGYVERIKKYCNCDIMFCSVNNKKQQKKDIEFKKLISLIDSNDYVILIDEKGEPHDTISFTSIIQRKIDCRVKKLVFIVGGAYGFPNQLYSRSNQMISLSKLTFTHELARLILIEQLYRSMTIINKHPYHHE